jgi:hypothetical protein
LANALDAANRDQVRAQEPRASAYDDATSLGMTAVIEELGTTPQT